MSKPNDVTSIITKDIEQKNRFMKLYLILKIDPINTNEGFI